MQPSVSVIIPTYKEGDILRGCLDALLVQSYPDDLLEIIVANNCPSEPIRFVADYPSITFIDEAKPGSYAARNAALAVAKGEIIAFTDADCTPDTHWIEHAVAALQSGVDVVAGHVELYFHSNKLNAAECYEKAFAFRQDQNARQGRSVTANMVTWKKCFDQIGLFDDSLMSGGDSKWSKAASGAGLRLEYVSGAVVNHPARSSVSGLLIKAKRVAGGLVKPSLKGYLQGGLLFVMSVLPPLNVIAQIVPLGHLSLLEKLKACWVGFLIKRHFMVSKARLLFGLDKPERV